MCDRLAGRRSIIGRLVAGADRDQQRPRRDGVAVRRRELVPAISPLTSEQAANVPLSRASRLQSDGGITCVYAREDGAVRRWRWWLLP